MTMQPVAPAVLHHLSRDLRNIHNRWNRDLPPVLQIQSGDLVRIETRDAADMHFTPDSTVADLATRDRSKIHPLTGPIQVAGAAPGDVLKIEILNYELSDWGWTVTGPGVGLLPDLLTESYFKVWRFDPARQFAEFRPGIRVPLAPFCGIFGVAPAESGELSTIPPRRNGGNMDIRHLVAGTTLYLPVLVPGALFSAGDGHAAQGDGEVCVSAIETNLAVTVRLSVLKGVSIQEPRYEGPGFYATTGVGTTILEAARKATTYMIEYVSVRCGLSTAESYALLTAIMDLKICETVDLPHYLVSAHVPTAVLGDAVGAVAQ